LALDARALSASYSSNIHFQEKSPHLIFVVGPRPMQKEAKLYE
jgi:hypothetical protein